MAVIDKLTVEIRSVTRYAFVFFPFATFIKVGEVQLLTVFGMPVYKRVGNLRKVLFFKTTDREETPHD